jgi:hypothetical protein
LVVWVSKQQNDYDWGNDVGLMWVLEGQGIKYLDLQFVVISPLRPILIK